MKNISVCETELMFKTRPQRDSFNSDLSPGKYCMIQQIAADVFWINSF